MSEEHAAATVDPASLRGPSQHDYSAGDWFWIVTNLAGGNDIYSSADAVYMADTDSRYTDWTNLGNTATTVLCDGELAVVLANAGLEGFPVLNTAPTDWGASSILDIIAAVQAAGTAVTSTGTPAIDGTYQLSGEPWATMNSTQIYVNAHNQLPNNQPLPWGAYSGVVTIPTAADFTNLFQGLNDYLQSWKTWAYHGGTVPAWGSCTIA